jgi:hypothetical protein
MSKQLIAAINILYLSFAVAVILLVTIILK